MGSALVIRLAAGLVPTGAWGDAISAIVLLGVVGVAVVVADAVGGRRAAAATVAQRGQLRRRDAFAEEAAEASDVAQTLSRIRR